MLKILTLCGGSLWESAVCRDEWTDGSEAVGKGGVRVGWRWGSRVGGGLDRIGGRWVGGKGGGRGLGLVFQAGGKPGLGIVCGRNDIRLYFAQQE